MNPASELLKALAACPSDRMLDPVICQRLAKLVDQPADVARVKLLQCLDDAAYSSLASDQMMLVMHCVYLALGGDEQNMDRDRIPGREPMQYEDPASVEKPR